MKTLTSIAALLFLAGSASAYELKINIPSGPGLTRLVQLCDWLRADPEINKPDMTNDECGERLFKAGAFTFNREKKLQELRFQGSALLAAEEAQFRIDLPMPADGIPPTPTATPTATPTGTPTATPTPTPEP